MTLPPGRQPARQTPMGRVGLLILFPPFLIGCAHPPKAAAFIGPREEPSALRARLQATGLSWARTERPEPQLLHVSDKGLRLVSTDEGEGEGIIVRFDRKMVYTLSPSRGTYRETPFTDLVGYRKKRERDREKKRKKIIEKSSDKEQADEWLRKYGLPRDGETIIDRKETGETREIGGRKCTRFEVVENGRTVMTVWSAADLARPQGITRFFSETGIVSARMAEVVASIPGFPMTLEIDMDYSVADIRISLIVSEVEVVDAEEGDGFEVPEGLTLVQDAEADTALVCPICGAEVPANTGFVLTLPWGDKHHYDKAECKEEHKARIRKEVGKR